MQSFISNKEHITFITIRIIVFLFVLFTIFIKQRISETQNQIKENIYVRIANKKNII